PARDAGTVRRARQAMGLVDRDRAAPRRPVRIAAEMTGMHVAIATDRTYLPWCATTLLSCLRSTPDEHLRFHVFHPGDITTDDRDRLVEMVSAHGGEIDMRAVGE